ncbi:MAG: DUF4400 domain-containing protein [Panacagrimonas sp.]
MDKSRLTGVLWSLKWALVVMALTLASHLTYCLWPYPQGYQRGTSALKQNLETEWSLLAEIGGVRLPELAYGIYDTLYFVLFQTPGFDYMQRTAMSEAPLSGPDELMRGFVLSTREFWDAAATGLQLFSARLGVLALFLPLLGLVALASFADGLVAWLQRRTSGGRESGFVYHRMKRLIAHSVLALAVVYLIPPVVTDPRWVLPPFALGFAIAVRYSTAYFKKYV